jgi:RNA methyltransferase, TrmH family
MKSLAAHSPRRVESRQNARIKELRAALGRGNKTGLIALEGLHLVQEAVQSGLKLHTVFVRSGDEALLDGLRLEGPEILSVARDVFDGVSQTEHPQGIAALAEPPQFSIDRFFQGTPLIVVAAGLQDPGNLGALIRSAEAFGATGMMLLPGTVSPWNAKALRASSGSAFRLPVQTFTHEEAFVILEERGVKVFAAVARDGEAKPDFSGPSALLVGNEGAGLPEAWANRADVRVTIPLHGSVESLNAMVAGSVLLYEAMRQRMQG